jgi:hypothetical protein
MSGGNTFPFVPTPLVDALNKLYPEKCPNINDSERLIWFKAGQRSVVDSLLRKHEDQLKEEFY